MIPSLKRGTRENINGLNFRLRRGPSLGSVFWPSYPFGKTSHQMFCRETMGGVTGSKRCRLAVRHYTLVVGLSGSQGEHECLHVPPRFAGIP